MTVVDAASGSSGIPVENYERELEETQARWLAHEEERRELSDARIRLVWDAVDIGGLSQGQVARAMSRAGKVVKSSDVSKFLACGYPEASSS